MITHLSGSNELCAGIDRRATRKTGGASAGGNHPLAADASSSFSLHCLLTEAKRRARDCASYPKGSSVEQLSSADLLGILAYRLEASTTVSGRLREPSPVLQNLPMRVTPEVSDRDRVLERRQAWLDGVLAGCGGPKSDELLKAREAEARRRYPLPPKSAPRTVIVQSGASYRIFQGVLQYCYPRRGQREVWDHSSITVADLDLLVDLAGRPTEMVVDPD